MRLNRTQAVLIASVAVVMVLYFGSPVAAACTSTYEDDLVYLQTTATIYGSTGSNSYGSATYAGTYAECFPEGAALITIYLISADDGSGTYVNHDLEWTHTQDFSQGDTGSYIVASTDYDYCDSGEVGTEARLGGDCVLVQRASTPLSELALRHGALTKFGFLLGKAVSAIERGLSLTVTQVSSVYF